MKKEITVSVTFSTLKGRKNLLLTLEEALKDYDIAPYVKSLLADRAAVGCEVNHPFYGRLSIDLAGRFE